GYWTGGVEADRDGSLHGLGRIILYAAIYTAVIPFASILGSMILGGNIVFGPIVAATFSLALPSYYLSQVSPYCIRLATKKVAHAGKTSGKIYATSTLGSIVGTFLSGFILIPHFKVTVIIELLAVFLFIISLYLTVGKTVLKLLDGGFIASMLVIQLLWLPSPSAAAMPVNSTIVFDSDSAYNSVLVLDVASNNASTYRLLRLGNLIQGGLNMESNDSLYEYIYFFQLPWLYNPKTKDILFLGNGAGVGINYLHSIYPDAEIDVVDIDPMVFEVAKEYFNERQNPNIRFYTDDARMYLKKNEKKYDLIIMDVYGSTHEIPNHLVTQEMLSEVKADLKKDGIYLQEVVSALDGDNSLLMKSVLKTTKTKFKNNKIIPLINSTDKRQTVILLSSDAEFSQNPDVKEYLKTVPTRLRQMMNQSINTYLLADYTLDCADAILLTDDFSPTEGLVR
ncbi:MAG: fused MFS/spermidine synthase, partial [Candidatus Altiarchaeota archaeon]|nr:fused MFS/spermidine synthase [Candidatus Altiarchaeota archaeon]